MNYYKYLLFIIINTLQNLPTQESREGMLTIENRLVPSTGALKHIKMKNIVENIISKLFLMLFIYLSTNIICICIKD